MSIPPFSFEATVSAEDARQDKLQFEIDHGTSHDEEEDVALFLHFLGSPPRHSEDDAAAFGRVFNRPRRQQAPFLYQTIRERALRGIVMQPPPLFSGLLNVIGTGANGSFPPWHFSTLLSLNPTRFVRHQEFPRPARRLLGDFPRGQANLYRRDVPPIHDGEFALMESDNWIPNDRLWSLFASRRFWQTHLRRCLVGATEEVENEIQRVAELLRIRFAAPPRNRFNLHSVETYFEFSCSHPIGTVLGMGRLLRSFAASRMSSQSYRAPITHEAIENSHCFSIRTRRGETLKIYAKTNRRIRFEVTHNLRAGEFRLQDGGHTFPAIEGALPLLQTLATLAAERVNAVLNHFRLHASAPEENRSILEFIADVQAGCHSTEEAQTILEILASNSSLVSQGSALGAALRGTLHRLTRRGVLVSSLGRYSVAPPYQQALETINNGDFGFLLGVRRRRRNR